jgi:hypothetical protein
MARDGIQFLMQLEAKLDGATKMVRELSKSEAAIDKADAALKKAEKSTNTLGGAMGKAGGAVKSFAAGSLQHLAALATWDGIKAGVNALADLGRELIGAAAEAERTEIAFKNMLGDSAGGELLDYLDGVAKKTEFTDGALKGFAQQLTEAGFAGEGLKNALAATLDVAARSPNKLAGAAEALGALEKIQLSGMVDKRALRALKLNPQAFFKQMGDDLGMGVDAVEKKLQAGKIKIEDVTNSVFKALAAKNKTGQLGSMGADMADTLGARIEKVKDIIPNLFEELSKSDGMKGVSGFLGRLAEAFDPASPVGQKVIGGIESVVNRLGKLLEGIDLDKWANRAVMAMEFLGGAFEIGGIIIDEFFRAWEDLNSLGEAIGGFIFDVEQGVTGALTWLGEFFEALSRFPADVLQKALEIGNALWTGIRDGLLGGVTAVTDAVSGMGDAIVGKLKGVLGISSPSKVFEGFGIMTAQGFTAGLDMSANLLEGSVQSAFTFEPPSLDMAGGIAAALPSIEVPSIDVGAGARGGGAVSLSVPITVNMGGTTSTPDEVADRIKMEVPSAIMAALEQLGLQGGYA